MINHIYEKIFPSPTLPTTIDKLDLTSKSWESNAKVVKDFKNYVKAELRQIQVGRCCFCRRHLFDDNTVDIEHFLEKSVLSFDFEIQNLALSCKTCNGYKNSIFLRISGFLTRKASHKAGAITKVQQCVVLSGLYNHANSIEYQTYRWVHPHFDNYSEHINIHKSWIYRWRTPKGRKTVIGLKLNLIGQIERRALKERLAGKSGMALLLAGYAEADAFKADVLINTLIGIVKDKKLSTI